jgi:antirestriction protein
MLDMTNTSPRIYVACLASYNSGILHGEWIDATADADEMQDEVNRILRASPCPNVTVLCPTCEGLETVKDSNGWKNVECPTCKGVGSVSSAEEYAIHDFDGIPSSLGEYCGLEAVAAYVEFIEACEDVNSQHGAQLADAMVSNWHSVSEAKNALDDFTGIYDSFRDYADEAADEMLACYTLPESVTNYFDYEAWARDLALEMTVLQFAGGVAVFHA